jgi:DNA modification methylase
VTDPVRLECGEALAVLRGMPSGSVQTCVTSPPYYGLRDYGHAGQIGLEPTPAEYVARLVEVFGEVRRVLRPDGTLWLNLGDSYASQTKGSGGRAGSTLNAKRDPDGRLALDRKSQPGYGARKFAHDVKDKDLLGIPWRVAFALQAAGWYLRQDVIWSKPNPMPESVRDRCTKSHEYLFLLSKQARYFFDADAIAEPATYAGQVTPFGNRDADARRVKVLTGNMAPGVVYETPATRNRRSVWTVPPDPYPGAHFAVMPPELVRPCVLAGTSARGCCPACGAPWARVVERERSFQSGSGRSGNPINGKQGPVHGGGETGDIRRGPCVSTVTTGWEPSCACPPAEPVGCVVLDPFAGSGTTLAVAREENRRAVGIELNPKYVELARRRLRGVTPALAFAEGEP